jgi:hypothetical protein
VAGPDRTLRLQLAISHVLGMLIFRFVIRVEPLASTPPEELIQRIGPVLQHHLRG